MTAPQFASVARLVSALTGARRSVLKFSAQVAEMHNPRYTHAKALREAAGWRKHVMANASPSSRAEALRLAHDQLAFARRLRKLGFMGVRK